MISRAFVERFSSRSCLRLGSKAQSIKLSAVSLATSAISSLYFGISWPPTFCWFYMQICSMSWVYSDRVGFNSSLNFVKYGFSCTAVSNSLPPSSVMLLFDRLIVRIFPFFCKKFANGFTLSVLIPHFCKSKSWIPHLVFAKASDRAFMASKVIGLFSLNETDLRDTFLLKPSEKFLKKLVSSWQFPSFKVKSDFVTPMKFVNGRMRCGSSARKSLLLALSHSKVFE